MKILVYKGAGAGPQALRNLVRTLGKAEALQGCEVLRVGAGEFADPSLLSSAALLVFPGGHDIYYHRDLKGLPNRLIYDYVSKGGCYLGICAGAYYGCGSISFEKGAPLEIVAERELAFFPGEASGPAYGNGLFRYGSESGARTSTLTWTAKDEFCGREYRVYFNGGCSFTAAESYDNTQVLARYHDIEGSPAAIVECSVGKGKALLCGVHPEFTPEDLDLRDPYLPSIHKKLKESDIGRRELLNTLLQRAVYRSNGLPK